MHTVTAVLAALSAALTFAVATSLQHRVAGSVPETARTAGLMRHVLGRPMWVAGMSCSVVALGLDAVAVHEGALALVQPILVTGIVFALPVRAALERRRPSAGELVAAAVTSAGLAVFLVAAQPSAGSAADIRAAVLLVAAGAVIAAVIASAGFRVQTGHARGVLIGCAGGVVGGLVAGTLKLAVTTQTGVVVWLVLPTLVVLGCWGVVLNQQAYRSAPLAVSMPIVNIVGPIVAIAMGYAVFGEVPNHRPAELAVEVIGLILVGAGLHRLAMTTDAPGQPVRSQSPESELV